MSTVIVRGLIIGPTVQLSSSYRCDDILHDVGLKHSNTSNDLQVQSHSKPSVAT